LQQTPSTQLLLVHSAPTEHGAPLASFEHAPLPLQLEPPTHSSSGSDPPAIVPHVPSAPEPFFAAVQAWQVAVHALLQQTPSTHCAPMHSAGAAQAAPMGCLHAPASHTAVPGHSASGSRPDAMTPHVPSAPVPFSAALQALQSAPQALLQHTPSTQKLLVHSPASEHAAPFASFVHEPRPLQFVAPRHSLSGSDPDAMLPQVPSAPLPFLIAEQAWHAAPQAVVQQTESTQWLLAHWASVAHGLPVGAS
jgi:hypothetical protein